MQAIILAVADSLVVKEMTAEQAKKQQKMWEATYLLLSIFFVSIVPRPPPHILLLARH